MPVPPGYSPPTACSHAGVLLADLNPATVATLRALLPEPTSPNNPGDTTAAVDVDTFRVVDVCAGRVFTQSRGRETAVQTCR